MKYCVHYKAKNYSTTAEEVIHTLSTIEELKRYIASNINNDARLLIDISKAEKVDENFIKTLSMIKNSPTFMISFLKQKDIAERLIEKGLKFFFVEKISNYNELAAVMNFPITDVYITADLAYNFEEVKKKTREIAIRVVANECQTKIAEPTAEHQLTGFFIRPEDTVFYEKYVDVIEFTYDKLEQEDVYLDIYRKGIWYGPLREIIYNFEKCDVDGKYLIPSFGWRKVNCRHKCVNTKCEDCHTAYEISKLMQKEEMVWLKKPI